MKRRLCAILVVDIVGYSRAMADDEAGTLDRAQTLRKDIFVPEITRFDGRIIKYLGDGAITTFASAHDAVDAALAIQRANAASDDLPLLRMGIHLGDVMDNGADIFGDAVNVAARLEALSPEGGMCLSQLAYDCLSTEVGAEFVDSGEHKFKNIPRPISVFSWPSGAVSAASSFTLPLQRSVRLALLPVEDSTGTAALGYVARGLDQDLAVALNQLDAIDLVTGSSTADRHEAARLGRELGADWILTGDVSATGDTLRTTLRLMTCATGKTVWAHRFDGTAGDGFGYVDGIVQEAATVAQVNVADGEQALVWRAEAGFGSGTGGNDAYQAFIKGRAAYQEYRRGGVMRAREHYTQALSINPKFPAAMVGLARAHIEEAKWGWSENREVSCNDARELLDAALRLAPDHALASSEMAHLLMVEQRCDEGLEWAMKATRLAPTLGDAYHVCATLLVRVGRPNDAAYYARKALRRAPATPAFYLACLCEAHMGTGQWAESAALARHVVSQRPDWLMARAALVISLVGLDQMPDAKRETREILTRNPRFSVARWTDAMLYPDRRDIADMTKALDAAGLPAT